MRECRDGRHYSTAIASVPATLLIAHGHYAAAAGADYGAAARRWAGYTLTHAGRQVRLGPIAFWIVVGTLVIMAGWTIVTATYFAFREDVLTRLIARQAEMQFAYEDRIAELRAQIDRISSRQLLDQEQYEQKLDRSCAARRRWKRAPVRSAAIPRDVTGSLKPPARGSAAPAPLKPSPMNDKPSLPASARACTAARPHRWRRRWRVCTASLDRVEARQAATLTSLEESYDAKAKRIRGVLAELGVDAGQLGCRSRGDRRSVRRRSSCAPEPALSTARSIASASRARRSIASPARSATCRCAGRWTASIDLVVRLRRAHRSVHPFARDAYRARYPRRDRRSGARHR